jgi:hypothetical protein
VRFPVAAHAKIQLKPWLVDYLVRDLLEKDDSEFSNALQFAALKLDGMIATLCEDYQRHG